MEAQDVLADDMHVAGPEPLAGRRVTGEADASEVVGQGVEPHVDHVLRIFWYGDAPGEGGARDRQVAQPLADEGEDLVAAAHRLDELRVGLDVGQQRLLVPGHAEEVAGFLELLGGPVAVRAVALHELVLGPERLAGGAVPVLVLPQVDVAVVLDPAEEFLHRLPVRRLGGAHETGVGDVEHFPQVLEAGHHPIGQVDGALAPLGGRLLHLLTVLVGAGEEEHLPSGRALVAGQGVAGHGGVGVTDVGHVVDVVDGRGHVEAVGHQLSSPGFRS